MRISRFYQTGLIFKTAAIFLFTFTSVASAEVFQSAAQCFQRAKEKSAQCSEYYHSSSNTCSGTFINSSLARWHQCQDPISAALKQCWAQSEELHGLCNQMERAENSRQRQEKIILEQQETQASQQREAQRRIQLSQQQYQRSQQAEAQQQEYNNRAAIRKWEQDQQASRQQEAQARAARITSAGNAVMGMINALMPKIPAENVDDVYRDTWPLKKDLQAFAMPGGRSGVAAHVQNASLMELKRYHEQIENDLKATMTQIETFDVASSGTSSRAASSTFKPSTSLPVNTGPNPWDTDSSSGKTEDTRSTATSNDNPWANNSTAKTEAASSSAGTSRTTEGGRTANTSSDNPWANDTANNSAETAQTGSNGYVQLARADTDNPWDTPPASSGGSQCDDIRAGKVKFKWDWSDKKGRRCFSNASKRANASGGAICCSW